MAGAAQERFGTGMYLFEQQHPRIHAGNFIGVRSLPGGGGSRRGCDC
jgi:hypothetical protein